MKIISSMSLDISEFLYKKKAQKIQTIKQYMKSKRSETIALEKGVFDCGNDLSLIHNLRTILICVLHICLQNL
jgi:hypothetical protein